MRYAYACVMARIDLPNLRQRLGGITQGALGEKLGGVSQSTISRLEKQEQPVEVDGPLGLILQQLDRETPAVSEVVS